MKVAILYILIVEDSSSMCKIINTIFSDFGFNTFLAPTLLDAREILNNNKIDYIILDINLPDGHGYELIKELSSLSTKRSLISKRDNRFCK